MAERQKEVVLPLKPHFFKSGGQKATVLEPAPGVVDRSGIVVEPANPMHQAPVRSDPTTNDFFRAVAVPPPTRGHRGRNANCGPLPGGIKFLSMAAKRTFRLHHARVLLKALH